MTYQPRVEAANSAEWPDLVVELDRWEENGRVAPLWWRDDDAVAPTAQFYRLLDLADGAPLALAVIPADATAELAAALQWFPGVCVLHHGWCHANRAIGGKKSEYPAERHPVDVADEFDEGRKRMRTLFGRRALPVFVPPWNRFSERFVPLLAEAGFAAISQMAPRKTPWRGGIATIDVDLDVVAWHEDRRFVGEAAALGRLVALLRARRAVGDDTAIGILTHHLVMDDATENFLARLGEIVAAHPAARWDGVGELLS
ncbi:MAG TPA: polysaccharide deacetylase family protein [Stellaceae bacterium]|nr:polysaccharide deacetylase family protein [Stellaceae bacterium]